jgi:hypothetical protein
MPLSSVVGAQSIVKPGVCTSTTRPASPFDGQVIYMTDVDQTAVWDGSAWVGIERSRDRNVIINGAMQVAQRGTSVSSITTAAIHTADRWLLNISSAGTWTQSIESDGPTGSGFRKSLKMLCTTADASLSASDYMLLVTRLEGQNLQHFLKGAASAKQFSLSFWVKSNVTGTFITELYDEDNARSVSASYTVSASATWEKKTIILPADITGAFDNDNARSLEVNFWLAVGSTFSSGTLATTWGSNASANRVVGQTNLAAATSNYWQITGVQLEAGSVATPFEFEDYGTTLAKCQRYYWRATNDGSTNYNRYGVGGFNAGNSAIVFVQNPVRMRVAPTSLEYASLAVWDYVTVIALASITFDGNGSFASTLQCNLSSGGTLSRPCQLLSNNSSSAYIAFSAEL